MTAHASAGRKRSVVHSKDVLRTCALQASLYRAAKLFQLCGCGGIKEVMSL